MQVKLGELNDADEIFSKLMGDVVKLAPRVHPAKRALGREFGYLGAFPRHPVPGAPLTRFLEGRRHFGNDPASTWQHFMPQRARDGGIRIRDCTMVQKAGWRA